MDKSGGKGLTLVELVKGVTVEQVLDATGCSFQVSDDVKSME